MDTDLKKISSGLEDYIEVLYLAQSSGDRLKASELAKKLNISRASVSEALSKLINRGLIEYKSYGEIILTPKGEKEAKKVYTKHSTIKEFFMLVLDANILEAEENACKIEHIISNDLLSKISNYTNFCKKHKDVIDLYREYSSNKNLNKQ